MGARAVVEMKFETGETISNWDRFSLRDNYTDPLGSLSFTVTPPRKDILRYRDLLQKGALVGVKVADRPVSLPIITTVQISVDLRGVSFNVEAQSVLVTPYEGSVDPEIAKKYNSDTPIETVVREAMGLYGFDYIDTDVRAMLSAMTGKSVVTGKAAANLDALKHSDIQATEGETAYGFCSRILERLGVVMRCDHLGRLIIGSPDYDQSPSYTLVQDLDRSTAGDRMLDDIEITDTNSGQFSEVVVRGKAADNRGQTRIGRPSARAKVDGLARPAGAPYEDVPGKIIKAGPHTYKSTSAPWKPRFALDKNARDRERCQCVATLMHGIRAASGYTLDCSVGGLVSTTGRVWTVDTVARVKIAALGLDLPMWLQERTLTQDRGGGQRTRLRLLPLGALVLGDVPS